MLIRPKPADINFGILVAAANAVTGGVIYHVFHTAGYHPVARVLPLLLWALAANIGSCILIGISVWRFHWKLSAIIGCSEILVALIPLVLVRFLRIHGEERLIFFGACWSVLASSKAVILAAHALRNVRREENKRTTYQWWVFCTTLLVYVLLSPWVAFLSHAEGDEPHYLLLSDSLVRDHDFDVANNYRNIDYADFYPVHIPDHHTLPGRNGGEYLYHDVGLPVLLVPAFAVGRRLGAMLELNLIASLLALAIYKLALLLSRSRYSALWAWAAFAFTYPLTVYSSQVFPEAVGAVVALWAVLSFAKFVETSSNGWICVSGVLLSILPWINIRFWVILGPLFCLFVGYFRRGRTDDGRTGVGRRVFLLGFPIVVSLVLFVAADIHWFNTPLPNAGYLIVGRRWPQFYFRGDIGLLGGFFDRRAGLISYALIYIFALAGIIPALRLRSWIAWMVFLPATAYLLFVSFSRYWTAGWCPAGRYFLTGFAMIAPFAALIIDSSKMRWLGAVLVGWGLLISTIFNSIPILRFPIDGSVTGRLWILSKNVTHLDFGKLFPLMSRGNWLDFLRAGFWVAFIILVVLGHHRTPQKLRTSPNREASAAYEEETTALS